MCLLSQILYHHQPSTALPTYLPNINWLHLCVCLIRNHSAHNKLSGLTVLLRGLSPTILFYIVKTPLHLASKESCTSSMIGSFFIFCSFVTRTHHLIKHCITVIRDLCSCASWHLYGAINTLWQHVNETAGGFR